MMSNHQRSDAKPRVQASRRRGASVAELLVSATLLFSAIGVVGKGGASVLRLWKTGQEHRLAVDTLSNQLEKLSKLSVAELNPQIASLQIDSSTQQRLPDAVLQGTVSESPLGTRITLELDWKRVGNPPPVTLVGWSKEPE